MKIQRRALLMSLALTSFGRSALSANLSAPGSELPSCNAWVDKKLKMLDAFMVTAVLHNKNYAFWAYNLIGFGTMGFIYSIKDRSTGKWLDDSGAPEALPFIPPGPVGKDSFIKIEPGMIVGAESSQKVSDVFPDAGAYTMQIGYRSPIRRSEISDTDGWLRQQAVTSECGTILAPPLDIDVS